MKFLLLVSLSLFVFYSSTYSQEMNEKALKKAYDEIKTGETDHQNAVSVATGIVDKGNNKKEIVVKLKVHPEYHIYSFVADQDPYIQTEIKIELPAGYTKIGNLKKPSFKFFSESGTTIYEDEVMFTQEISGNGPGEAACSLTFQCCDDHICFPPVINKVYKVKLP